MQLLSVVFLLMFGCATTPPPGLNRLPEGLYRFDCPVFYDNGMVRITHTAKGARVQLLEKIEGSFTLRPDAEGHVKVVEDHIDYPGLKRSLNGEGRITAPGQAEGRAAVWLKSMGPLSRDHRKGPWTLRRATEAEARRYQRKQELLRERRERAREGGLDI